MTTDKAPELLPCPFCGAQASYSIETDEGQRNYYDTIACSECPAGMQRLLHWADNGGEYLESLSAAWNLRAALEPAAPSPDVLAWQPIEAAPCEPLLLYGNTRHDTRVVFTGWKAVNGRFYADTGDIVKPTHWMPLPLPPALARITDTGGRKDG